MIKSLFGVRGIAVLLVFTAHTPIRLLIGDFGQQAVYIFFILSSFLLSLSLLSGIKDIKGYMKRRFFRIYPLYGLIVTILTIFAYPSIKLSTYILNMLFLQAWTHEPYIISVSWTLVIEIQMYILLPLMIYILNRDKKFSYKLLFLIIFLSYVYRFLNFGNYLANAQDGSMKILNGNLYEVLDIFMIGILLAKQYKDKILFKFRPYQVYTALIIFLVLPKIITYTNLNRAVVVIFILIPVYSILMYILFSYVLVIKEGFLNYILNLNILHFFANISYSFYLIHLPILRFFRDKFENIPQLIVGMIAFGTIVFLSWFLNKYWEQLFYKTKYK